MWARRDGAANTVSFPARPFVAHRERRNFALLTAVHDLAALQPLRGLMLEAYEAGTATAANLDGRGASLTPSRATFYRR